MFYNNNLKGYGKGYVGRKNVAERPPKDRRGITNLGVENQRLVILCDSNTQYAGFQEICNCHEEGIYNPRRREKECGNVFAPLWSQAMSPAEPGRMREFVGQMPSIKERGLQQSLQAPPFVCRVDGYCISMPPAMMASRL